MLKHVIIISTALIVRTCGKGINFLVRLWIADCIKGVGCGIEYESLTADVMRCYNRLRHYRKIRFHFVVSVLFSTFAPRYLVSRWNYENGKGKTRHTRDTLRCGSEYYTCYLQAHRRCRGPVGSNDCRRHPLAQRPAHRCCCDNLHATELTATGRGPRLRAREI